MELKCMMRLSFILVVPLWFMFETLKELLLVLTTTVFFLVGTAYAAHPLITDDTGTQGRGKAQLEFMGEYEHDRNEGLTTNTLVVPTIPVLSYGLTDAVDLVLGISYQRTETQRDGCYSRRERSLGFVHRIEMEIL